MAIGRRLKGRIVIHRSIDSTEIDARESAATKDEKTAAAELAAIRAQVDANTEDYNALALQKERDLDTNLSLLPTRCDWGCKRNSKGKTQYWRGYKLHIAVADWDFPIATALADRLDAERAGMSVTPEGDPPADGEPPAFGDGLISV